MLIPIFLATCNMDSVFRSIGLADLKIPDIAWVTPFCTTAGSIVILSYKAFKVTASMSEIPSLRISCDHVVQRADQTRIVSSCVSSEECRISISMVGDDEWVEGFTKNLFLTYRLMLQQKH